MELKIKGLKKLASESKQLSGYYSGHYMQVNYNISTGEVWGDYFYSLGQNMWTEYNDKNVIICGNISEPTTMKEIRMMIKEVLLANHISTSVF